MLEELQKTISMSQLAKHAERIADEIEASGTIYRIKRRGHPAMLLVSDTYVESLRATLDFFKRHPNWSVEMDENRAAVRAGRGVSLQNVVKDRRQQSTRAHVDVRTKSSRRAPGGTTRGRGKAR